MSDSLLQRKKAASPAPYAALQVGGPGDDVFFITDPSDNVLEAPGQGRDVVYSTVSWALMGGSHVEVISTASLGGTEALNLTGNELVQEIYGNAGANTLNGGGGADTLVGLGGDDAYLITDGSERIVEAAGEGRDVAYTSVSHVLGAGIHVEVFSTTSLAGTQSLNLTGNELAQEIYGNAGANVLNGGGGADQLIGVGGDDTYFITSGAEQIIETAGNGRDVAYTSVSHVLGAGIHVEILSTTSLAGTAALNLTGNELAQEIYGNAGANVLNGGGGADLLIGVGGDDTYFITGGSEQIIETAGNGRDVAYASVSHALGAGISVEVLSTTSLAGTAALDLTGNELAQEIYGNAGANTLNGGGGADLLIGVGGDDVYFITSGAEQIIEAAGEGRDVVYASVNHTLGAGVHVEVLSAASFGSTQALDLTGNELAQEVYGNAGANVVNGGGGADYLAGNGGADSFAFTTALGGGNVDTVGDFTVGTDLILLGGGAGEPFAALASGAVSAGAFVIGSAALQADDVLIYNSGTGALLYDADGNGAGAAVQFATLATGLSLTAADFTVSGPANSPPSITSGASASIAENSAASTIVYQTAANDANGDRITYSLSGTDAGLLNIDAVTGAVRLNSSPDFETKASYTFNVVASDSGSSTSQAVTLTITDVADASTPIINETAGPNDQVASAQFVDRGTFVIASNPNLPDSSLPSATIVGNLPDAADKDFFSITLQAGEKLILDVDNSGGNLDAHVRVYNAAGVQIGDNDDPGSLDPGSDPHPTYGHNTDSLFSFRAPSAGTYYFSIESFQDAGNPTFGSYQLHVSIGPPATPAQILAEDVDALISGAEWNHTNLTFGFPTIANQYPNSFDEANPDEEFQPFNASQQAATRQLLQLIANVSPLTFTELTGGTDHTSGAGSADLRYAMTTDNDVGAAHAYYPTNGGPTSEGGSAWFNTTSFNTPVQGRYAWMGILHETGHALGLKHGHEAPAVSLDHDSVEYTVMTYRSFPGQVVDDDSGYTNEMFGYPQTLMILDIAALQKIYGGANYAFNSGDSVYTWSPTTGQMFVNGVAATSPGGNRVFLTVWDGGGTDTYDLSAYTSATIIDLRPGEWTTTSVAQIANLGQGHAARGNVANALMFEGNTGSLIENAVGTVDTDTITANQVKNQLTGGGGADVFRWMASSDLATGGAADTITDFVRGSDHIDLSNIDAIPATGADDAFSFIGTSAFSNTAGQLRYQVEGANLRVQGDLDGNGVADLEIVVNNNTIFGASDFFL